MELSLFFVRERVIQNKLHVAHIPSIDQPADLLTKAISSTSFAYLREKLTAKDLQKLKAKRSSELELRGHVRY